MVNRMNSELANDLGNLAQRVLSMVNKNCAAVVPTPGELTEADLALLDPARALLGKVRDALDRQVFHDALEQIWVVVRAANAYVDHQAPWALRKTDPDRMATVLWVLIETIRHIALLMQIIVPTSAGQMLDQLSIPEDERSFEFWGDAGSLKAGTPLPKPQGVFPRYVEPENGESA